MDSDRKEMEIFDDWTESDDEFIGSAIFWLMLGVLITILAGGIVLTLLTKVPR